MKTVGLWFLFVLGMAIGALLALPIFVWALLKRARPIHFDGVVVRAQLEATEGAHAAGARLHGPAIFRLSGGG